MAGLETKFFPIIPAGGAGTRLWPLSRAAVPKFLLDLTGSGRSLLQQTWDRLEPLGGDNVVVVTGSAHSDAVSAALPQLAEANLFAEPSPRDSMAAIGLACAVIERRAPGAVVGSFAADHVIGNVPAFHDAVRQAIAVAQTGKIVTLGIQPTFPSTAFGYIRISEELDVPGAPNARSVGEFREKPTAEVAEDYLAQGCYRWNAGMFIAQASTVLSVLAQHRPALHTQIQELALAWDGPDRAGVLASIWPQLEKIAFDYAIAEPAAAAGDVAVIPADLGWDDIGDFHAWAGILGAGGSLVSWGKPEQIRAIDSTGIVVANSGRVVAVVGMSNVVVVDTPDAVLVTSREAAQQVKQIVGGLKAEGRTDLL